MTGPSPIAPTEPRGLGTFGGVFTPSILTILGVIMYLRFGWVVGNAGLTGAFAIVTIATAITFLTGLSISQIATDQRIKTGGAYYMISRALGIEVGGAIGIPLYFAQALSVALYTIGFAESLGAVFPILDQRLVAAVTTIAVTGLALISARTAIRVQYFIMAGIAISLVSFLLGSNVTETPAAPEFVQVGFWQVFAVFFPAVTGIMAGVNMSGDLADPRRSIPRGTLAAIGVSYVIYMIIPVVMNARADAASLVADPLIMRRIAIWGDAILVGVWGATLSSALGSILGAPRILQALARDNILPKPLRILGRGSGPDDEPRLGTYVSLALALAAVALGDLDVIAPILTMFFLATYAVVNVVSAVERFLRSPSFRPTFRVHWALSLLGALGCGAVMFLINPIATIVAAAVVTAIYLWLQSRGLKTAWGDIRQGAWQALVRWGLLNVRAGEAAKSWRPNFLVLAGSPAKRWYLIDFANSASHDRGILSVATILPEPTSTERKQQLTTTIRDHLEERGVEALIRVVSAPNPYVGVATLVEAYGLGSLVPNTVLMGDGLTTADPGEYGTMIARIHQANRSVVVVRAEPDRGFGQRKTIDVWLHGIRGNGALMITLAHLLATSLDWRGARITVRMIVENPEGRDEARSNLRTLIDATRIEAGVEVLVDERPPTVVISEASRHTDLTFIGLATPKNGNESAFTDQMHQLVDRTSRIPTVAYVLASAEANIEHILA
ncbi:MAG: Na-K-Cl cotransporter [Acidimicrobiia bacterium]|nr:Na-K-Cl cotransporter [Acidimicrobiia bacterium]